MDHVQYWQECISEAADEAGAALTPEQINAIASSVQGAHENYGMAFYSPPPSDRISSIEREYKAKITKLEADAERYRDTVGRRMGRILHQFPDARITVTDTGEVLRHGGRTERLA